MNDLFEQIANIQKASAYDILRNQQSQILAENERLKERVKSLEKLIDEYTGKMMDSLTNIK